MNKIKIEKIIYISMKIKPEHLDTFISCPFTGKMVNTTFIDPEMYPYYYNTSYKHLFQEEIDYYKSEIEIEPDLFDDDDTVEPITSKNKKN